MCYTMCMYDIKFATKGAARTFVELILASGEMDKEKVDVDRVVNEAFVYYPDQDTYILDVSQDYLQRLVEAARV